MAAPVETRRIPCAQPERDAGRGPTGRRGRSLRSPVAPVASDGRRASPRSKLVPATGPRRRSRPGSQPVRGLAPSVLSPVAMGKAGLRAVGRSEPLWLAHHGDRTNARPSRWREVLVACPARLFHQRRRPRPDTVGQPVQSAGQPCPPQEAPEGYAAGWTMEQLRDTARRITDKIDALIRGACRVDRAPGAPPLVAALPSLLCKHASLHPPAGNRFDGQAGME